MEPKFQTSFIPKKSLSNASAVNKPQKKSDLLFMLGLIMFLASLVLAGGVFAYGKLTKLSIDRKAAQLEEAKSSFDLDTIAELSRLSKKMAAADELLQSHISAATVFSAISESTLKSIQFEDFSYDYQADKIIVSMRGKANGFSSIALQSDLFGKSKVLKKPVFSDLDLDNAGKVKFLFNAEIDPGTLLYKNTLISTN